MPSLTPQLFSVLGALIRQRLGIHYQLDDLELVADRVGGRALAAGFESLLDYYYFLRYDDPQGTELAALADALVVNESYLFREFDAIKLIVGRLVPAAIAAGRARPRIWSAACAAGEEPLTLAMALAGRGLLEACDLVASDLSQRVLDRAAAGTYTSRALRVTPDPDLVQRYVEVAGDGTIRVAAGLRQAITWHRTNLVEPAQVAAMGRFDVILCRNVLIYFDEDTVREVVASLAAQLLPGGVLFVGISESLMRFGVALQCDEQDGVFYYRKVTG